MVPVATGPAFHGLLRGTKLEDLEESAKVVLLVR